MKKYVFILLWLYQGIAGAHGPTSQKIEERVTVNASQEAVRAMLEDFQAIAVWHPLIAGAEGEGSQTGAERTPRIKGREGLIIESLDEYELGNYFLAYRLLQEDINVIPVSFYTMTIKLSAGDDDMTNWFSDDLSIVDLGAAKETRRIPAGKGARAFGRFISP